jgi:hypothetical membrane protein
MDWGFIIIFILAILGAALVAGGVVMYRGSKSTAARAFGAAGIAGGLVMWAIVVLVTPVSVTQGESPVPVVHFEAVQEDSD